MAGLMFVFLFIFLILGVPIAFALGISGLVTVVNSGVPLIILPQRIFYTMDSFVLLSIPMFLLAGNLMEYGGVTQKLIDFAKALIGHVRGGLAYVNVLVSMIFAAISGSPVSDTSAVGSIMMPAMKKEGYNMRFVTPLQAAAGSMGGIIPPSIPMIIFAVTAGGLSIKAIFMAGIVPGILVALVLLVLSYIFAGNVDSRGKFSWRILYEKARDAVLAMFAPFIILGGIISGYFTPTESAVIAVLYALIVGMFVYRKLSVRHFPEIAKKTALATGMVMMILGSASLYSWILSSEQVPQKVAELIMSISDNKWVILIIINFILLIAGTFLDTSSAIIGLVPILYPIAVGIGIDPVHFAIIFIINLSIGMLTPPVGITLMVASSISKVPLLQTMKHTIIVVGGLLLVLVIVTVFPDLVLYVPNMMK